MIRYFEFENEIEKIEKALTSLKNNKELNDDQIKKFYGSGMISMLPREYTADHISDADFIIEDEQLLPQINPQK